MCRGDAAVSYGRFSASLLRRPNVPRLAAQSYLVDFQRRLSVIGQQGVACTGSVSFDTISPLVVSCLQILERYVSYNGRSCCFFVAELVGFFRFCQVSLLLTSCLRCCCFFFSDSAVGPSVRVRQCVSCHLVVAYSRFDVLLDVSAILVVSVWVCACMPVFNFSSFNQSLVVGLPSNGACSKYPSTPRIMSSFPLLRVLTN